MSVESWARRASGLLVPTMGFANPLGKFQVCPGPCCFDPQTCLDCGNALYQGVWVELPELANARCQNCAMIGGTYWATHPSIPCSAVHLMDDPACVVDQITVWLCYNATTHKCLLKVQLSKFFTHEYAIIWELELTEFADPIDHILPYRASNSLCTTQGSSSSSAVECSGVGTTVHVYE